MGHRFRLRSLLLAAVLSVLALLPHSLLGSPGEERAAGRSPPLRRVKRGWVWNQFFVLEEYTGLEPLYIGKVSTHHTHVHVVSCGPQRRQLFCVTFLLWLSNVREAPHLHRKTLFGTCVSRPTRTSVLPALKQPSPKKKKYQHNLILECTPTASLLSTLNRSQTAAIELIDWIRAFAPSGRSDSERAAAAAAGDAATAESAGRPRRLIDSFVGEGSPAETPHNKPLQRNTLLNIKLITDLNNKVRETSM